MIPCDIFEIFGSRPIQFSSFDAVIAHALHSLAGRQLRRPPQVKRALLPLGCIAVALVFESWISLGP